MNKLKSAKEIAEDLNITRQTVDNWINRIKLEYEPILLENGRLVKMYNIDDFLNQKENTEKIKKMNTNYKIKERQISYRNRKKLKRLVANTTVSKALI